MLNLKSKKIEIFVTDAAGNILRDSDISVKVNNGYESTVVYSGRTNDSGKFISTPLPSGVYQIFESNTYVGTVNHFHDKYIQCFKPLDYNIFKDSSCIFNSNTGADKNLNNFRWFLQIEAENIDIDSGGSTYPIYDMALQNSEYDNLVNFFKLTSESRISTIRFDCEYYLPLTKFNLNSKRIRLAGVPAIRFKKDSKLVIPLDYYSIVPSFHKIKIENAIFNLATESGKINVSNSEGVNIGDIIKVQGPVANQIYFRIVQDIIPVGDTVDIYTVKLLSSRFLSLNTVIDYSNVILQIYDGLFNNITDIVDVNSNFIISENNYAQNNGVELYYYSTIQ